ncbi:glycosyltransferase [Ideonella livida]|uniref:Glycosyltransferase n=1 Tax=Ideonella livida TaxID=2707176 RepID=A0A7C9TKK7_9BURK|nr:glycosyltransferase [Ideonella livida]NDY90967.1 glycosyltransferase [Ideonella livida]
MIEPQDITVVIPALDVQAPLGEAIVSVLAHGGLSSPVLVADASGDPRTADAVARLSRHFPLVQHLAAPGATAGEALNLGLSRCTTGRVLFLEAQDQIVQQGLRHLAAAMAPEADLLLSNHTRIDPETGRGRPQRLAPTLPPSPPQAMPWKALAPLSLRGVLWRTAFLRGQDLRFAAQRHYPEAAFMAQAWLAATTVCAVDQVTCTRHPEQPGCTLNPRGERALSAEALADRMRQILQTVKTTRTPAWRERFKRRFTLEHELSTHLFKGHVLPLAALARRAPADARLAPLLAQLQAAVAPYEASLKTLPAEQQPYWQAVLAQDAAALSRLDPTLPQAEPA